MIDGIVEHMDEHRLEGLEQYPVHLDILADYLQPDILSLCLGQVADQPLEPVGDGLQRQHPEGHRLQVEFLDQVIEIEDILFQVGVKLSQPFDLGIREMDFSRSVLSSNRFLLMINSPMRFTKAIERFHAGPDRVAESLGLLGGGSLHRLGRGLSLVEGCDELFDIDR